MDHALEASTQRIRHHLRRPLAGSRDLLMKTAGNTVSETDPRVVMSSKEHRMSNIDCLIWLETACENARLGPHFSTGVRHSAVNARRLVLVGLVGDARFSIFLSSGQGSVCTWFDVKGLISQYGPEDVDASASKRENGLAVALALSALAVVEGL